MSSLAPAIRSALASDARRGASLTRWSVRKLLDAGSGEGGGGSFNTGVNTAKTLLREVQIRLAVQHGRLNAFSESINRYARVAKAEGDRARRNLSNLQQLHENTYRLLHEINDGDGRALLTDFTAPNRKYVSNVFDQIMARHGTSVETLADAVIHARNMADDLPRILARDLSEADLLRDAPIESFLHARLLIQLLCEHYVSLHKGKSTGAVSLGVDVADVIDDAVTESKHVCDANLGVAPEVEIRPDESLGGDFNPPPLIRSWMHHAIVEVSKNAMTSNVRRCIEQRSVPATVHVKIDHEKVEESSASRRGYLRIRIIDQGTGVTDKERAFGFARSTSGKRWDRLQEQQSYAAVRQPLGSLGVGLTLSRLMMRAFGGDLDLANHRPGSGIDSGCTATLRINYDDSYMAEN
ncbi:hypothetical protein ACHAWF_002911 [Thalassiosira exigua]